MNYEQLYNNTYCQNNINLWVDIYIMVGGIKMGLSDSESWYDKSLCQKSYYAKKSDC